MMRRFTRLRGLAWAFVGCAISGITVASQPLDLSYCTVCHGTQGNGNPAIRAPKIAGMEPWYLKRQLALFRSGLRGTKPEDVTGSAMQPMVLRLDDDAIEAVARYVASFEPRHPAKTVQGDVARGKALYESCAACHGPRGEGMQQLGAPALASRSDWYLVTQLELFRSGLRGFSEQDVPGTQMRAAAALLPDAEAIRDVVAYINTFSPSNTR
jgi:cytochrome c553